MTEFSSDYPLNHGDMPIKRVFKDEAKDLLYELINNRLHVVLVPAPEPKHQMHMIRAVESQNPDWYRELYNQISGFRRDNSKESLKRLAKAQDHPAGTFPFAKYDSIYRDLCFRRLVMGHEYEGDIVEPNQTVVEYFGVENLETLVTREKALKRQIESKRRTLFLQGIHCADDKVPF